MATLITNKTTKHGNVRNKAHFDVACGMRKATHPACCAAISFDVELGGTGNWARLELDWKEAGDLLALLFND